MNNLIHWNKLKTTPKDALKEIVGGKLKGKSDINPQWRYEVMTEEFGICGIGWKYEIVQTWTQQVPDNQLMLFVQINLYIKEDEQWSEAIPAIGGDFLIEKDKNGIHGNDEAYKMATTDALGVAMKMLGVAADVYRGKIEGSKYSRSKTEYQKTDTVKPETDEFLEFEKNTEPTYFCETCEKELTAKVAAYSQDKFGKSLCYNCQKAQK